MIRLILLTTLGLLGCCCASLAQTTITGQVRDLVEGTELPGVNILVKGTSVGTITDIEGNFSLSAPAGAETLVFSSPASAWFDFSAVKYPGPNLEAQGWRWYPWLSKVTTPGQHPDALYANRDLGLLTAGGGSTYTDTYYLRLADTYLLRAEAYLGQGNTVSAAADVNTVRSRADATPVAPGQVTIDYILDERARELSLEEDRRITLSRVGKLVERVRLHNAHNGPQIQDYNALWPVPISEIDANIDADLDQNPGY